MGQFYLLAFITKAYLTCASNGWLQVRSTGQLDTILTFYEITDPPIPSPLTGVPDVILRRAVACLARTGRAQLIGVADGDGARFFAGRLT